MPEYCAWRNFWQKCPVIVVSSVREMGFGTDQQVFCKSQFLFAGKHRQISEVSSSWRDNPDAWKNHYILLIYSFCLAVASFQYDSSEADMKDVKKGTSLNRAAHFHFVLLKSLGCSKLLLRASLSRCWNIYNTFQMANVTHSPLVFIFCLAWPFRQAQAGTLVVVPVFPFSQDFHCSEMRQEFFFFFRKQSSKHSTCFLVFKISWLS